MVEVDAARARRSALPDLAPPAVGTRRRHICIVTDTYPPEVNGVALTLARLVGGLRTRGHAVSVLRPFRPALDARGQDPDHAATLVRGVPLPGYRGLHMGLPAGRLVRRRWTVDRPDVVYVATEGPLGWSAVSMARRLGIPVFSGFHTDFPGYARHYRVGWLRPVVFRYLRSFHNRTVGTFVATIDLGDRLRAAGFANVALLGRGVDSDLFTPERRSAALRAARGLGEDGLAALYVGRLAAEKNIGLAVDAYRAMQRSRGGLRFVIVGDGPLRAALQQAHPDLVFCGMRFGQQLAACYASADVFLFPSETETFGNVTLEAMASGLAVVAYDYAAAAMHVRHGETGVLVRRGAAAAFVEGAAALARSPRSIEGMRRQARLHATSVDWHRVVRQFETLLNERRRIGMLLSGSLERWATHVGLPPSASGWLLLGLVLGGVLVVLAARRAVTAVATWRALALTPTLARRLSGWVKTLDYSDEAFFQADGAGEPLVARRRAAIGRLAAAFRAQYPQSIAWERAVRDSFSDLRFTDASRVPFPFARFMREHFNLCAVVTASEGPHLRHLDGHSTLDVSGSYGVNVAGFTRYKEWMRRGLERVQDLGPVLGPLHPLVADNIVRLRAVSKQDEVSFHMSGTEAVMAAVRLARFNTRRKLIVAFSGAYHGWWDGVQPGLGSERTIDDCLTLKDLDPASLDVIRRRAKEIAAVLINPIQSFHPNAPPPSDAVLLTSGVRKMSESSAAYGRWLCQLRELCDRYAIPLVFDEVYTGFRLAPGGAQEFFGVQADMVVYGKTVAGGMPIGVVCGKRALMQRFDPAHPMRVAFVVGTFSAHPVVMGAMKEFLRWLVEPATAALYEDTNRRCAGWVQATNRELAEGALPLRVVHLGTIWTVLFTEPGRYNWLLQYYFRAEGVTMSWVGTGRCLISMDFTSDDYAALQAKLVQAARRMKDDGWWPSAELQPGRETSMRRRLAWDMVRTLVPIPPPVQTFHAEVMRRKHDDHHASHSNEANQILHIVSSSAFIACYALAFWDLTAAMWIGLAALFLRQLGHAVLEPPCHDKEALLLGFNTRNKTMILAVYLLVPVVHLVQLDSWSGAAFSAMAAAVAREWFVWTLVVVGGRVAYLVWAQNLWLAMVWFVKLLTDPLTDISAYSPRYLGRR
jgi:glutamate-1-semialdehyde 2,1-aminomutase